MPPAAAAADSSVTANTRVTLIHAGLTARPNPHPAAGPEDLPLLRLPDRKPIYVGKAQRACGRLTRRVPLIPYGTRVRLGTWKIYSSNRRRYAKRSTLLIYPFEIFRTVHL